ncbi:MAG: O-linked N-acetylglucosamine transferase, SPINDLY family protein [Planctomycetota bacterium]|jgi:predicted O-linked N-acetylglucosamine transferase (SPINDLY family)
MDDPLLLGAREAYDRGDFDACLEQLGRYFGVEPGAPNDWVLAGNALVALGRVDDASGAYQQALQRDPHHIECHLQVASLMEKNGQPEAASRSYELVLQQAPDHYRALVNYGGLLLSVGAPGRAIELLERARGVVANGMEASFNLAAAYQALGRYEDAIAVYESLQTLKDRPVLLEQNLAKLYLDSDRYGQALEVVEVAKRAGTHTSELGNARACALLALHRRPQAFAVFEEVISAEPRFWVARSNAISAAFYDEDVSLARAFQEATAFGEELESSLPSSIAPCGNSKDPERPLRVGFVSPDLRRHSVAYFLEPLLESMNRSAFIPYAYAHVKHPDSVTERLQGLVPNWRSIHLFTDEQVVQQIREDGVDILVDLAGHTENNRLPVFAWKPAPVQVTWLGYPATTGVRAIDYRLTDAVADPDGDEFYVEKLVRLSKGFLCYQPPEGAPKVSPPPAIRSGSITFGSFNNVDKVSPHCVALWAQAMHKAAGSRMVIKAKGVGNADVREWLLRAFAEAGIAAKRLELIAWMPSTEEHLSLYHRVDVALDTYPYHGTTTTLEALYMGVPVLSLQGNHHVSRVGASILSRVGLDAFVVQSEGAWEEQILSLAGDLEALERTRNSLRGWLERSPLMDAEAFARQFEAACRSMWRTYCEEQTV